MFDTSFTFFRRLRNRENVFAAHRSHLYQRLLIATGWSHARLLAFHLPFYLLSGLAGLLYFHSYWCGVLVQTPARSERPVCTPAQMLCILGVTLLLAVYTLFVVHYEKRKGTGS